MMTMFQICLLFIAVTLQDEAKPLPELQPFLAEFRKTLHTDDLILSDYTYTEKETSIQLDSNNRPKKTEVNIYQVFSETPDHPEYRRQIVKNGVALTAKELEKQDAELKKKREADEKKRAKTTPEQREKDKAKERAEDDKIIDDLFAMYDIRIAGRENIGDHATILVTFNPRPNAKPKTRAGKIMQHIAGKAWISEDDHELARIEADAIDTISVGFGLLARLGKGSHVAAERRKFNDEVWLPVREEISVTARVLLVKGFNVRETVEYSDHKKFSVDTKFSFPELEK